MQHIISYRISQGRLLNVIAFYTVINGEGTKYQDKWFADVPTQEVVDCYKGWEPEVLALLKCMEKPAKWAIHVVDSLPLYVDGKVALLGDAAHAMTTHFASGAGQAIEDAYILGRILSHPSTSLTNIPQVLRFYQEIRLPFANNIVQQARLTGLMYEFNAPGHYDGERGADEQAELKKVGETIEKQWEWQVIPNGGPNEDWRQAEVWMKTL
jgi:salicylate hydroxylase